jgi:glutamine synthetase
MYAEGHKARGAKKLPLNLLDSLRELQRDKALVEGLGAETVAAYSKLKRQEWDEYMRHLSDWERRNAIDC